MQEKVCRNLDILTDKGFYDIRKEMENETMNYQSTRNRCWTVSSTRAVLEGIAPDGGLYISRDLLQADFDWRSLLEEDTFTMSRRILSALLPDFDDMGELVQRGYAGKFESDELTPLVRVGDRYVLELFHGPTSAFKDVALSILPQLITAARRSEGVSGDTVILTATSGDTGKAALEGFHDVPGTRIIVFYPEGGVSAVQQAQMVTQEGRNVCVCAVRGNFDDAQTGVKNIFAQCAGMDLGGARLSSANSINIGRLAPQVVYYFKAYADLVHAGRIRVGDKVHFVVPTGNFGDILAGFFAKLLGLPVGRLVCASNANDAEKTIGKVWAKEHYLCDPHTAVAWTVADQFMAQQTDKAPVVVLSTASPYKFPAAVLQALGRKPDENEFAMMDQLRRATGVSVPKGLAQLQNKSVLHRDVIDREDMLSYVLKKVGEAQW